MAATARCRRASRTSAASPTRARPSAGNGSRAPPSSTRRICAICSSSFPDGPARPRSGMAPAALLPASRRPSGVGVDFSAGMIGEARKAYPDLTFLVGDVEDPVFVRSLRGPFDVIVVVDTLGALDDCQAMFASLHDLCTRETRLVIGYFSHLWY